MGLAKSLKRRLVEPDKQPAVSMDKGRHALALPPTCPPATSRQSRPAAPRQLDRFAPGTDFSRLLHTLDAIPSLSARRELGYDARGRDPADPVAAGLGEHFLDG